MNTTKIKIFEHSFAQGRLQMNKKGLIGQLVLIVLAVIGGFFLLKYFGVI